MNCGRTAPYALLSSDRTAVLQSSLRSAFRTSRANLRGHKKPKEEDEWLGGQLDFNGKRESIRRLSRKLAASRCDINDGVHMHVFNDAEPQHRVLVPHICEVGKLFFSQSILRLHCFPLNV